MCYDSVSCPPQLSLGAWDNLRTGTGLEIRQVLGGSPCTTEANIEPSCARLELSGRDLSAVDGWRRAKQNTTAPGVPA